MQRAVYEQYTSSAVLRGKIAEEEFSKWGQLCFTKQIVPLLPQQRDARILDLGCGYGHYLLALQKLGYTQIHGIDLSEEQVVLAQKLGLSGVTRQDACDYLDKSEHLFDAILMLDLVEHLEVDYLVTLIQSAYQKLRPGGVVIIQTPNGLTPSSPLIYGDLTHYRAYTPESLEQVFRLGGFSDYQFYPASIVMHGVKSVVRRCLWQLLCHPLLLSYHLITFGSTSGGIYTPNLIARGYKQT